MTIQEKIDNAASQRLYSDIKEDSLRFVARMPLYVLQDIINNFKTKGGHLNHQLGTVVCNGWHGVTQIIHDHFIDEYKKQETELFYSRVMSETVDYCEQHPTL